MRGDGPPNPLTSICAVLRDPLSPNPRRPCPACQGLALTWFTVLGAAVSMGLMKGAIAEAVATAGNDKTDGQAHTATGPAIDRMRQHISCVRALLDDALDAVTLPRPGIETALLELHTAAARRSIGGYRAGAAGVRTHWIADRGQLRTAVL